MPTPATHRPGTTTPAWRVVNTSPIERVGRVLVGLAAAVTAIVLLTTASGTPTVLLGVLLLLAALDWLIRGATGHCPLYARLGRVPRSSRSRP